MKKSTLIGILWGAYLGASLTALTGVGLTNPRWWIIVVPTVILITWDKHTFKNEN